MLSESVEIHSFLKHVHLKRGIMRVPVNFSFSQRASGLCINCVKIRSRYSGGLLRYTVLSAPTPSYGRSLSSLSCEAKSGLDTCRLGSNLCCPVYR
jgi:hypothetical protein